MNLDERISRIQTREGWTKALSLSEMEDAWRGFVEVCESGYQWSIYEYENDLSERDRIALILDRDDLSGIEAVECLRRRVGEIDERFRSLLKPGVSVKSDDAPWWRRGVLRYAGEEYAKDIVTAYGISIERR